MDAPAPVAVLDEVPCHVSPSCLAPSQVSQGLLALHHHAPAGGVLGCTAGGVGEQPLPLCPAVAHTPLRAVQAGRQGGRCCTRADAVFVNCRQALRQKDAVACAGSGAARPDTGGAGSGAIISPSWRSTRASGPTLTERTWSGIGAKTSFLSFFLLSFLLSSSFFSFFSFLSFSPHCKGARHGKIISFSLSFSFFFSFFLSFFFFFFQLVLAFSSFSRVLEYR